MKTLLKTFKNLNNMTIGLLKVPKNRVNLFTLANPKPIVRPRSIVRSLNLAIRTKSIQGSVFYNLRQIKALLLSDLPQSGRIKRSIKWV